MPELRRIEVVDDAIADILRKKTGWEKIQMVASGWTLLRAMHTVQVRAAHPDWEERTYRSKSVEGWPMEQLEFFRKVIGILNPSGLHYMVVGSFASGFWGEPRSTFDMDVVIAIAASDIPLMIASYFLMKKYYFSPEAAREAIRLQSQFNVIHPESGNKIDFLVRRDDDWSREQFNLTPRF